MRKRKDITNTSTIIKIFSKMARQADKAAIDRIKAAREKSLKIMKMDMNGSLNKIVEGKMGDITNVVNGSETQLLSEAPAGARPKQTSIRPMQQTSFGPAASKLPSAILESFKTNKIGDDAQMMKQVLAGGDDLSFLDEGIAPQRPVQRQVVTETVQQPQYTVQQAPQQIDYPMIRTIVEEIVRKYAGSITKKVLSESKGSTTSTVNTMMLGEKFKFLTDDGDIYECTTRRVGNVKDRKKNVNG